MQAFSSEVSAAGTEATFLVEIRRGRWLPWLTAYRVSGAVAWPLRMSWWALVADAWWQLLDAPRGARIYIEVDAAEPDESRPLPAVAVRLDDTWTVNEMADGGASLFHGALAGVAQQSGADLSFVGARLLPVLLEQLSVLEVRPGRPLALIKAKAEQDDGRIKARVEVKFPGNKAATRAFAHAQASLLEELREALVMIGQPGIWKMHIAAWLPVIQVAEATVDGVSPQIAIRQPDAPYVGRATEVEFDVAWQDAGSGVDLSTAVLALDELDLGSWVVASDGGASFAFPLPEEGSYLFRASIQDRAGNRAVTSVSLLIDRTPPHWTGLFPPDGAPTNADPLILSGIVQDDRAGVVTEATGVMFDGVTYPAPGTAVRFAAPLTTGEGVHHWQLIARDRAGNIGRSVLQSVVVDRTPPTIRLLAPGSGARLRTTEVTFVVAVTDVLTGVPGDHVAIKVDGGERQMQAVTGDVRAVTVSGLTEGVHVWTGHARDRAGNAGYSSSLTFVVNLNDPPVVYAAVLTGAEDSVLSGQIQATDPDGDMLTFRLLEGPRHGHLTVLASDGAFSYKPTPDSHGLDSFVVVASDGITESAPARIWLDITPVNDLPVAMPQQLSGPGNRPLSGQVVGVDVDGDPLSYAVVSGPSFGSLQFDATTGFFVWRPVTDFAGKDHFTYRVSDGTGWSDPATVQLAVSAVVGSPYVPVASPLEFETLRDVPLVATFAGAWLVTQDVRFEIVSPPASGVVEILDAGAGRFRYTPAQSATGQDSFMYRVRVNGVDSAPASVRIAISAEGLPPDPALLAPPIDRTVPFDIFDANAFLYSGPDPVQRGVDPDAIDDVRMVVLRGRVVDQRGEPLAGVRVSVRAHPELGYTWSRLDGVYDLVLNGGGFAALEYRKSGYLPVQRDVSQLAERSYISVPDVVMLDRPARVFPIRFGGDRAQTAALPEITDERGRRRGWLFLPPGVQAAAVDGQGVEVPLTTVTLRGVEFTNGPLGPLAMPGALPDPVGYTYAVDWSVEELAGMEGFELEFRGGTAFHYVDNFLDIPIGSITPAGSYDYRQAAWRPEENGYVFKVAAVTDGRAQLSMDGANEPRGGLAADVLDALGFSDDELRWIAQHWEVGESFWRVPIRHLSVWDLNYLNTRLSLNRRRGDNDRRCGSACEPDAPPPNECHGPTCPCRGDECDKRPECTVSGSVVECTNQALRESLPLVGTPYTLWYSSRHVPGRTAAREPQIEIEVDYTDQPDVEAVYFIVTDNLFDWSYRLTYSPMIRRIASTAIYGPGIGRQTVAIPMPTRTFDFYGRLVSTFDRRFNVLIGEVRRVNYWTFPAELTTSNANEVAPLFSQWLPQRIASLMSTPRPRPPVSRLSGSRRYGRNVGISSSALNRYQAELDAYYRLQGQFFGDVPMHLLGTEIRWRRTSAKIVGGPPLPDPVGAASWDPRDQGFLGWLLDVHHQYDPNTRTLLLGNGERIRASDMDLVELRATRLTGRVFAPRPGSRADMTQFNDIGAVAAAPDGQVYLSWRSSSWADEVHLSRIDRTGRVWDVYSSTAIPFDAPLAFDREERLLFVEQDTEMSQFDSSAQVVRRLERDGTVTTVLGGGALCSWTVPRTECHMEPRQRSICTPSEVCEDVCVPEASTDCRVESSGGGYGGCECPPDDLACREANGCDLFPPGPASCPCPPEDFACQAEMGCEGTSSGGACPCAPDDYTCQEALACSPVPDPNPTGVICSNNGATANGDPLKLCCLDGNCYEEVCHFDGSDEICCKTTGQQVCTPDCRIENVCELRWVEEEVCAPVPHPVRSDCQTDIDWTFADSTTRAVLMDVRELFVEADGSLLVVMADGHGVRRTPSGTVQEFWRPLTDRAEADLADATLVDVGWVPSGVAWALLRKPDGTQLVNRYDKFGSSTFHALTVSGATEPVQLAALESNREGRLFVVTDQGCVAEVDGWYSDGAAQALTATILPAVQCDGQAAQTYRLQAGPRGRLFLLERTNGADSITALLPMMPDYDGNQIRIGSRDGRELYVFDRKGRHLETFDLTTGARLYAFFYGAHGYVTGITDRSGRLTRFERDATGELIGVVSPYGEHTVLSAGADGYLAEAEDPAGYRRSYTYQYGLMQTYTDPDGGVYRFGYDPFGRLVRHGNPDGGAMILERDFNNERRIIKYSPEGRRTEYEHSRYNGGKWSILYVVAPGGGRQLYMENRAKWSGVRHHLNGSVEGIGYASQPLAAGGRYARERTMQLFLGDSVAYSRLLSRQYRDITYEPGTGPTGIDKWRESRVINGRSWSMAYDLVNPERLFVSPAGRVATRKYDANGRIIESRSGTLAPVFFDYDAAGNLTRIVQAGQVEQRESRFAWDSRGLLRTATDPLGRVLQFEWDANRRLIGQTLPDGERVAFAYDGRDLMTRIEPPGRPAHEMNYTPMGLESSYDPPDVGVSPDATLRSWNRDKQLVRVEPPDAQRIDYTYNSGGRLQQISAPGLRRDYVWSKTGRVTRGESDDGVVIESSWIGPLPSLHEWSGPVSGRVHYTWDNNFWLTGLQVNDRPAVARSYDSDGLLIGAGELQLYRDANGLVVAEQAGEVTTAVLWNEFGEPVLSESRFGGSPLASFAWQRDALGRVVARDDALPGQTDHWEFEYDDRGRLTAVWRNGVAERYSYDANGNRLSRSRDGQVEYGIYDDQDRLLSWGSTTYEWDANGDLVAKEGPDGRTGYGYDALGNLRAVTLPTGVEIRYLVDAFNRRVAKLRDGVLERGWLYKDQLNPVAEVDAS
ncbi:MAG: tandem-95 repeat protein, partial [Candidatus Dadabacteria bacterium]